MKKKMIILVHPVIGEISYVPDHAKALMAMPNNGGWEWKENPTDEKESTESSSKKSTNGIGAGRNTKDSKRA